MTRTDLISRIRLELEDEGISYYTSQDVNDSLQDGIDEIVSLTLPSEKVVNVNFVANKVYYNLYNSINDYLLPLAIFNNNTNRWLDFKSIKWLQERDDEWEKSNGEPEVFALLDYQWVCLYPHVTSAVGTFDLYYKFRSPRLGDSTPIEVLEFDEQILTTYVVMDLLEQAEEFTKASARADTYFRKLESIQRIVEGRSLPDRIQVLRQQYLGRQILVN